MRMDVMDLIEGWRGEVGDNEVDIYSNRFYLTFEERRWNMANILEVENDLA